MLRIILVLALTATAFGQRQIPAARTTVSPSSTTKGVSKPTDRSSTFASAASSTSISPNKPNLVAEAPAAPASSLPELPTLVDPAQSGVALGKPIPASIPDGSGPVVQIEEGVPNDVASQQSQGFNTAVMPQDQMLYHDPSFPVTNFGGANIATSDLSSSSGFQSNQLPGNQMVGGIFPTDQGKSMPPITGNFGAPSYPIIEGPGFYPPPGFGHPPVNQESNKQEGDEGKSSIASAILRKIHGGSAVKVSLVTKTKIVYESAGKSSSSSEEHVGAHPGYPQMPMMMMGPVEPTMPFPLPAQQTLGSRP